MQAPERDSAVDTDERYSSLQFSFQEPKNETEDPPCTEEDLALLAQYDKTFDLIYEDPALETAEAREAQALLDDPQAFSNIEDPMTRCVIAGLYEIDP